MVCVKLLISNFGALHLKHLRVTSRGIICLHMDHGISYCTISFVICSLQVGGGFETLITKEISRSNIVPYWFPRVYSLDGLICLRGGHDFHVFNPTTRDALKNNLLTYTSHNVPQIYYVS